MWRVDDSTTRGNASSCSVIADQLPLVPNADVRHHARRRKEYDRGGSFGGVSPEFLVAVHLQG
jgi:hypothetical protein